MPTYTTRNNLEKPGYADAADIAVINDNMDIIDASLAEGKFDATTAPTVNDDDLDGYSTGSIWIDVTGHEVYICESASTGAAVWRLIYPGGVSPVISASDPTADDDSGDGYAVGQIWFNTTNNRYFVAKDVTLTAAKWMLIGVHNNFGASAAPTANDDIADGYGIGSQWLDTTNNILYVCKDHSSGAAVWKQIPMTDYAWDAGAVEIRALTFQSDVATGTAPFTVASTTQVANLNAATAGNADTLDSLHDTDFVKQTLADAKGDLIVASAANTWAREAIGSDMAFLMADSSSTNGVTWTSPRNGNSGNLLINGSFLVNQTGITQYQSTTNPANSDDTYLLDQWILLSDGNDIMDVWQANTTYPAGRSAAILLDTETANKKAGILQIIENRNCRHAIGSTVSLRFQAYTPAANPNANIMAAVISWSGTSDTVTSDVVSAWENAGTKPTLVANWTYENEPAQLALVQDTWTEYKIENIAIDTASTTNIAVFIWLDDTDSTVGDKLYISGVQLNIGSKCLPWSARTFQQEMTDCARYYLVINSAAGAYPHLGIGAANTQSVVYTEYHHPTEWLIATPPMTEIGNWVVSAQAVTSYASEGDKKQITYRNTVGGTPFTLYLAYLVYGNNDTTSRVYVAARL